MSNNLQPPTVGIDNALDTENNRFTACTALVFATDTLGTEIGFVQFYDTAQRCLLLAFVSQTPPQCQVEVVMLLTLTLVSLAVSEAVRSKEKSRRI